MDVWSIPQAIGDTSSQFNILEHVGLFFNPVIMTVLISVFAIMLGFGLGIVGGLARVSRLRLVRVPATAYVDVVRGTPLLVQLFLWYFGLTIGLGVTMDPLVASIIAVGVHSGAYQSEIVRGGVNSIPKGQEEAARATGMTHLQAMRFVILPQALRLILPPLTNEFVIVIKDSSLASVIAVVEITAMAGQLNGTYFQPFEIFIFAAFLYLCLTYATSFMMRALERKYHIPGYGDRR